MRWTLKPKPSEDKIKHLAQALNVEDFVATLLIQRGIETFDDAKNFFRPSLEHLHDPFLMKDMDKAVARIELAIENQENILVFGDYDVDGTTAVSLVSSYLKSYYPNIATYIPDRYDEGYGISYKGIDYADDNGISLIIALDCGIKSIDHIAYAKAKNIDFIICDHHRPGEFLPDAIAKAIFSERLAKKIFNSSSPGLFNLGSIIVPSISETSKFLILFFKRSVLILA